ncbi:hypothetical protein WCX18_04710 [Sulfurimonas sp. HSL1-2]|uniref:DUF6197 family protein n=1 Tax=Thiomicrolovo zhangzhouensis TaxID=3131933 RepID=UPI0031F811EF
MKQKIVYILLALLSLGAFIVFGVIGVYKTENGIVLGLPDYEKRSIHVSPVDLEILVRADTLLADEGSWRKEHLSDCSLSQRLDLYCALKQASVTVTGRYVHRQPAIQEVRFAIDDLYRERWSKHRLIDFNTNQETHFSDIKSVLARAIATVKTKLER